MDGHIRRSRAWRAGSTGYPLVDAGIRQLHATGWMHPHVRAVAASWLCFDLGVDWRIGREEWDRWLIEDEPALATGNWQWIAGVGADMAQYPRIYNPERQRRRYDPAGAYVRRWVHRSCNDVPLESWYGRRSRFTATRARTLRRPRLSASPCSITASRRVRFCARYRRLYRRGLIGGAFGHSLVDPARDDRDANLVAVPGLDAVVDAGHQEEERRRSGTRTPGREAQERHLREQREKRARSRRSRR